MNRIKELRKEKKLSQNDLAAAFSVAQNTVSQWETGSREMDASTALKMANFFGVSTDYLLGNSLARGEVTFDDFSYAFFEQAEELTEENKQKLLEMARFFKAQQDLEKQ